MKEYEVRFKIKTSGALQSDIIRSQDVTAARKLIQARYGEFFQTIFSVHEKRH